MSQKSRKDDSQYLSGTLKIGSYSYKLVVDMEDENLVKVYPSKYNYKRRNNGFRNYKQNGW